MIYKNEQGRVITVAEAIVRHAYAYANLPNAGYDRMPPDMKFHYDAIVRGYIVTDKYVAMPTGDIGFNSGRPRYKVECRKCGAIAHENTTGPDCMYEIHAENCK